MSKSSCLEWTYWRSSIDYRVASLSTRSQSDKGIILESLKSIGQFYQALNNEKSYPLRTDGPTVPIYRKDLLLNINGKNKAHSYSVKL